MELGNFSVSLTVADLQASKTFYEKLGFEQIGGDAAQNWLIMSNGGHNIGLFHGMFEKNILTFNPGWDSKGKKLEKFTDVRDLHKALEKQGVEILNASFPADKGPGSFAVVDPDGNPILIDQHV